MRLHPGEVETGGWRVTTLSDLLRRLIDASPGVTERPRVIAIDGRGGAGKSTLVGRLQALVGASAVVHTDDVAWNHASFDWADILTDDVLRPLHRGEAVDFRPRAWAEHDRPGAISIPAGLDVVWVEGPGIIRAPLSPWIDASVYVQGDLDEQDRRLAARDGESAAQQQLVADWMAEELPFMLRERPWRSATIVVDGASDLDHDPDTEVVVAPAPATRRRRVGIVAELIAAGTFGGPALDAAVDAADADDVAAVIALTDHTDPDVRAAVARQLPLMIHEGTPVMAAVDAVVGLTRDAVSDVRDWACFTLGEQWREVDTPAVRQALAERLDDVDTDTRCKALVGLAYRQDPRALPAVRAALARTDGVHLLELVAAGALSDPGLHELVGGHLEGWDERDRLVVEAIRRLTDPAGIGQDLLAGAADLYRHRAHSRPTGAALTAWHQVDAILDINPRLAPQVLRGVADLLADDDAALAELQNGTALAQLAAAKAEGHRS